ncbi:Cyclin-dependent protein kinase [Melia azedarach]|uniref:Cyclin-dependent protein kinase n=1 Tax=Melia azedarach TaxID=155640 RepID=A0ACC1YM95_MELAZ|nr:Cyclin-dependent protein kinase [Melia azedarach]
MAPSARRTRSSTKSTTKAEAKTTKRPRRTQYKKKQKQQHVQQVKQHVQEQQHVEKAETMEDFVPSTSSTTTTTTTSSDFDQGTDHIPTSSNNSGCSTPRAERFRIPEIVTCPPAPKKQRVVNPNCSLRRTPIAFFAPPDLELFFFFALRDISV